ncbi:hypothetical protein [Sphingobium sp. B2]|uniref:hypothetical protein n=1 Tax=Sphingobium sp. B2 TaxID=2583228 RepID=UPI0011A82817|nr:hypothetical protein [Sphingobium sp. B2]
MRPESSVPRFDELHAFNGTAPRATVANSGVVADWQSLIESRFSANSPNQPLDATFWLISRLAGYTALVVGYCVVGGIILS